MGITFIYIGVLIDRIKRKVQSFLNTDGYGNFSPEDFNVFLHDAIQDRYEELFGELNRWTNRANRGLVSSYLENMPNYIQEKLQHYLVDETTVTLSDGETFIYDLPADINYLDNVMLADGSIVELCGNNKEWNITKTLATAQYPVAVRMGSTIKISPTPTGAVSVSYLRTPLYPKWTYQVIGGNEVFDPSNGSFVDADIHPSEENEMVLRVLKAFGVNLKEEQVQAFVNNQEVSQINKENAG